MKACLLVSFVYRMFSDSETPQFSQMLSNTKLFFSQTLRWTET